MFFSSIFLLLIILSEKNCVGSIPDAFRVTDYIINRKSKHVILSQSEKNMHQE